VGTDPKCGGCLWYGVSNQTGKLGECKNADSAFYWDQGDQREAVQIGPHAEPCTHYKSARLFLAEDNRPSRWRDASLVALIRTGLYQLSYPLVLAGVFFYGVFRTSPDPGYTRTEAEELSLY
jgi:hypothetical protein